jgi:hypothetical protein
VTIGEVDVELRENALVAPEQLVTHARRRTLAISAA